MVSWEEYGSREFREAEEKYLPPIGEGDTMATQAITAVNKLVYKWYNDGDVYDNTGWLSGWCNDLSSYANWLHENLGMKRLEDIHKITTTEEYEDLLWDIAIEVLSRTVELDQRKAVGSIYECDGMFEFVDYGYDEEDEEDEWC